MTDVRLVPLDQLKFGHEADPPINARQVGRSAEIETLAASLAAHGLIQALVVREIGGTYYVADGNRRLAALRLRAERHDIASDHEVRCDFTTLALAADADEISLAANLEREPLHEADTYEKFHELADRGLSEDQIAARFGIEPKRVRRMLALGRLSPMILKAWRDGVFGRDTVASVRAFTLAPSVEDQEAVFKRLQKDDRLSAYAIRNAFGGGSHRAETAIRTAGLDAYIAAGGRYVEDLFENKHIIFDIELAEKLAVEKFESEKQRLRDEGWSWVAVEDDLPTGWTWGWEKLRPEGKQTAAEKKRIKALEAIVDSIDESEEATEEQEAAIAALDELSTAIAARGFSAEQKAMAGAVVNVNYHGDIEITLGVVKPETKKVASSSSKSAGGEAAETKVPEASEALRARLNHQLTAAAQKAIVTTPYAALAALVATITRKVGYASEPVMISMGGGGGYSPGNDVEPFETLFARFVDMGAAELIAAAADAVAPVVFMHVRRQDGDFKEPTTALLDAMDGEALSAALVEAFDADDYFNSVPKALIIGAIIEAINADEARKAGKMKKPDLVAFAIANVPKTGWLPPELRTSHYSGPGAAEPMQVAAE